MHPDRSKLIDSIRQRNREFRKLEEKHKEYETKLDELMKHTCLTQKQEMLKQEIKKQKLWTKDRMTEIINGSIARITSNGIESSPKENLS